MIENQTVPSSKPDFGYKLFAISFPFFSIIRKTVEIFQKLPLRVPNISHQKSFTIAMVGAISCRHTGTKKLNFLTRITQDLEKKVHNLLLGIVKRARLIRITLAYRGVMYREGVDTHAIITIMGLYKKYFHHTFEVHTGRFNYVSRDHFILVET